jgi:hypothetical protein
MTGCCLLTSVNAFEDPACKRFGTLARIPSGRIGMRSTFFKLRMSLSENRFPLFRDMR